MEWTDEKVLSLIESMREKPVVWDPTNIFKKNKAKRGDAFRELAADFPPASAEDIQVKWKNLTQTYRNARRKLLNSKRSGTGRQDICTPTWFAYATMDVFMNDTYMPQNPTDAVSRLFIDNN